MAPIGAPLKPPAPLLLHAFSSFEVGGAQVRFATLVNHFGPRWRHAIVAMDGNLAARARLDPALDVTFPSLAIRKGDTIRNASAIRRLLRQLRPAMLHTSNWGTIEWAMANRLAVVPHMHVEDGFGPEERATQLRRRVWIRRVFLARRIVVVPSLTLRRIALDIWRLNPARVHYVPNGIDLDRFSRPPATSDRPTIGTIAGLRPEKNIGRLLRAVALLPHPPRLIVVGDGPQRTALEAQATQLGLDVEWTGYTPDPASILRRFDLFAISSDTEQMPMSLLEAMAAGLPVASTDVGDIAAMLPPEQRSFVVRPDDAALSQALASLLHDPVLRQRLGTLNRARAETAFNQDTMFAEWARLFDTH